MTFNWIGKSQDGNTVLLHKLNDKMFTSPKYFTRDWASKNSSVIHTGAVIDVETTGLDLCNDKIIEIGLRLFKYNCLTGDILSFGTCYSNFQDPGIPLSDEIKLITNIDDDMLKGQNIDWEKINSHLSSCNIIIAHNALFDRPFIDNQSTVSNNILWGCSFKQIGWMRYGFPSSKLDALSIYHGFFTDPHRAMNDVNALLYLLSHTNEQTQKTYLLDLLQTARKPSISINALNAPYEKKDFLKARRYQWIDRVWRKEIDQDQLDDEIEWLKEMVYSGSFSGETKEIKAVNRFKKR